MVNKMRARNALSALRRQIATRSCSGHAGHPEHNVTMCPSPNFRGATMESLAAFCREFPLRVQDIAELWLAHERIVVSNAVAWKKRKAGWLAGMLEERLPRNASGAGRTPGFAAAKIAVRGGGAGQSPPRPPPAN